MYYIGLLLSFIALILLLLSVKQTSKEKMMKYQFLETIFGLFSNVFFLSFGAAMVCIVSAFRNYLISKSKYTKIFVIIISLSIVILGVIFNSNGFIGYIPIFASLIYSIFLGVNISFLKLKIVLVINIILWTIFCLFIKDYPSIVKNVIVLIQTFIVIKKDLDQIKISEALN